MRKHAYDRINAAPRCRVCFEVSQEPPTGVVIEEILLLAEGSFEGEREGQVRYLPSR